MNSQAFSTRTLILIPFLFGAKSGEAQQGCDAMPPSSAFTIEKIADAPYAPYDIQITKDGRVFWVERQGYLKVLDPVTKQVSTLGTLDVLYSAAGITYSGAVETGLEGFVLAQDFETSHWVYLWYAVSAAKSGGVSAAKLGPIKRLSRFTLIDHDKTLDPASEKIIYQHKVFAQCCHYGGSMDWGPGGALYLSTGDNTEPKFTGASSPQPYTESAENTDPRNTSSNTNDPRGKILRIKPIPFPDTQTPAAGVGTTYEIPAGNLRESWNTTEKDKVLPEIYSMGHRNPFSIRVHPVSGWIGVGEANGDREASENGIRTGDDEINLVTKPGYFGWPILIGDNKKYIPSFWQGKPDPEANAAALTNDSKFNTGAKVLPPAVGSLISVYHGATNMPMGCHGVTWGWVDYNPSLDSKVKWPPYLADKLLVSSYGIQGTPDVRVATIDATGKLTKLEVLFTSAFGGQHLNFTTYVMRARQGPDGAFYLTIWDAIEFGKANGKIMKVSYTGNCSTVSNRFPRMDPDRSAPARKAIVHLGSTAIDLPPGIHGATAYDISGRAAWRVSRKDARDWASASIPASVPSGRLQIDYSR